MKKKITDEETAQGKKEGESGGDSTQGGADGSTGGGGTGAWIPSYYDLLGITADEKELIGLADQALFEQRISVKSQGIEVTALSKMQKLRNKLMDPNANPDAGNSAGFDEHPELADMAGDIDPNIIVLPESEAAERASNDPKLQNKLRNRLAAKFGMGADLSMQSMKAEYEKKMRMRASPAPQQEPRPRYRPADTPKPRPN